jgi:signal transduction histidine kinase
VRGDSDLLELVISNLLDNAIKYSTPPAHVEVELSLLANEACIAIKDRGIGIPAQALPHIFERFYAVDKARSRKFGGAGLGLSIAKTIVEKHGGRIAATSELGSGSCFTIALPVVTHF